MGNGDVIDNEITHHLRFLTADENLRDGCQVVGEQGGSLHNVTLDVRGSDCVIKGVTMSGFGP
ncbi:hypothetical protein, partial [Salmonella enterica]|uniref:hypothetical protein n=1 Tax=Salmonella enterica TaxID=28901 RepID=UPI001C70072D